VSFFTAEDLSPLFTHEDFKELKSPYTVPLVARLVERLNAKRDAEIERLQAELTAMQHAHSGLWDAVKTVQELRAEKRQIQDSNREYSASLVQEIVTLKDDNALLREALVAAVKLSGML
jgi:hypothetical protein